MHVTKRVKLNNGLEIPCLGLGFWESTGAQAADAVRIGAEAGYRRFDTAMYYKNEKQIGEGILRCNVPREELWFGDFPSTRTEQNIYQVLFVDNCRSNDDVFFRYVTVAAAIAGSHFRDCINCIHAFNDFAEDTVAEMLHRWSFKIQKIIIHQINKELAGSAVRRTGSCHGNCSALVGNLIVCLVFNRSICCFLAE